MKFVRCDGLRVRASLRERHVQATSHDIYSTFWDDRCRDCSWGLTLCAWGQPFSPTMAGGFHASKRYI